jgi:hypothetical protein
MCSSKNSWEYILLSTFEQKTLFSAVYRPKSVRNCPVFCRFLYIPGGMGAYLTPLTPSTTTPCLGTPPANSQRTKQFLSPPHSL